MRVLITGISGFVGSHMADLALSKGAEVHGTYRWRSNKENIAHIEDKISLHECDITDAFAMRRVVEAVRPDYVFHLAAQSYVPASWVNPAQTLDTNIRGQVNLLEAVRLLKHQPRIQIAGSSEEYGKAEKFPIKEDAPLQPLSPYGVSKVAQDLLGFQYFKSYKMDIVRTRGFNHTGPRRGEVFVCSSFAKQVAEIEKGKRDPVIHVGNLDAKRDFTDVRDMVNGYWLALEKGRSGDVYNICSGRTYQVKWILDYLLSKSSKIGLLVQEKGRMRPSDLPVLLGDNTKFSERTGWKPEIYFEDTLNDLLNYWRERVGLY